MSRGQMTTIACVLTILGFGACGGGRVPPPPLPPVLTQVHTIGVEVGDSSGHDLVNTDLMSRDVALTMNAVWKGRPIHVEATGPSTRADAALRITILRKTFSCGSPNQLGFESCDFLITSSIVLKATDGQVLWHFENYQSHFTNRYKKGFPPNGWSLDETNSVAAQVLAFDLLDRISHFTPTRSEGPITTPF